MLESPTINRLPPELKSKDFYLLRDKGIEIIQELGGQLWTDHNAHDPGITILEALCYIITEIGNKTELPIPDLLYSHPDGVSKSELWDLFFRPFLILPNCPLTINDYRKLLISIKWFNYIPPPTPPPVLPGKWEFNVGIRDAFLYKRKELEQTFYCQYDQPPFQDLQPEFLSYVDSITNYSSDPVLIKGVYDVQLEFQPKSVNENIILLGDGTSTMFIDGDYHIMAMAFPYWDELESTDFTTWANKTITVSNVTVLSSSVIIATGAAYQFLLTLDIIFSDSSIINNFPVKIKVLEPDVSNLNAFLTDILTDLAAYPTGIFKAYFDKYKVGIEKISWGLSIAKSRLMQNRNLCEDFKDYKSMRYQEVELCGGLKLVPGANPYEVLLQIFWEIEQFFAPDIPLASFETMVEEGYPLEKIYEGPFLWSGFIREESLESKQRENAIYTSDLVNIIMDVSGVLAIQDLRISNFIDNTVVVKKEPNCIKILSDTLFRPRLDAFRSIRALEISQNGIVQSFDKQWRHNLLQHFINKVNSPPERIQVINPDIPIGNVLPVNDYYSIQHDFPLTYGIGKEGLPPSVSTERKAQAKQLKSYLLFYEQLLANSISQLVHLKDYFSISESIERTNFFKPLYEVPNISSLLTAFTNQTNTWPAFIADTGNAYMNFLGANTQDTLTFLDRRNRFLDHILARFAESFLEYAVILSDVLNPNHTAAGKLVVQEQLIKDKIDFLRCLPEISQCRAQAYNYIRRMELGEPNVWDNDNVSGFEKRVSKKLGFKSYNRRNLHWNLYEPGIYVEDTINSTFNLFDNNGNQLLQGLNGATTGRTKEDILKLASSYNYQVVPSGANFIIQLRDGSTPLAEGTQNYPDQISAWRAIGELVREISNRMSSEGMHLIEHVLLRPRFKGSTGATTDRLLRVPGFPVDEKAVRLNDPYSFTVTIILTSGYKKDFSAISGISTPAGTDLDPGTLDGLIGTEKLRNPSFRKFAEETIRKELPVHVFAKILWLDVDTSNDQDLLSLNNFERVFKNWLVEFGTRPISTSVIPAQRELVYILNKCPSFIEPPFPYGL